MPGFTTLKNWLKPVTKEEQLEQFQADLRKGNEELRLKKSAQALAEEAKKSTQRENNRERQRRHRQRKALVKELTDSVSGKTIWVCPKSGMTVQLGLILPI